MSRDDTFLLALVMLAAAALAVGVSGLVLLVRDRRLGAVARDGDAPAGDAAVRHEAGREE